MIDKALKFLVDEINSYLTSKRPADTNKIVLDNISRIQDGSGGSGNINKIILSLVNIEEDRLSRNPDNFYKTDDNKVVYKNSPVYLNVYCLFAYNHGDSDSAMANHYEEALKYISYVVRFFQHRNPFTPANSPALDPGIEKTAGGAEYNGF